LASAYVSSENGDGSPGGGIPGSADWRWSRRRDGGPPWGKEERAERKRVEGKKSDVWKGLEENTRERYVDRTDGEALPASVDVVE